MQTLGPGIKSCSCCCEFFFPLKLKRLTLWQHFLSRNYVSESRNLVSVSEREIWVGETKNCRSRLVALILIWFLWDGKETTPLFEKTRDIDPGVVVNLHTSHHSHHGLGGYNKLINGLTAAASGAIVCCIQAYSSHVNIYIIRGYGMSVVLSSMTPSFLTYDSWWLIKKIDLPGMLVKLSYVEQESWFLKSWGREFWNLPIWATRG